MYQLFNQVVFSVETRADEQTDKPAHHNKNRVEETKYQDRNARYHAEYKTDFSRAVIFKAVNKKILEDKLPTDFDNIN